MKAGSERLGLVAVSVVAFAHYAVVSRMVPAADDYYVFLRYADNALAGHGLTFNPSGERVEGYSSVLYLLFILGFRAMGFAPAVCGRALGAALFVLAPISAFPLGRAMGISGGRALILPLALATSPALCIHACSAMESPLLVVLVIVALVFFFRGRLAVCGLLLGAIVLTRPEGVVVAIVLACGACFIRGRAPASAAREVVRLLLAGAAVVAPHLVWRRVYYGAWLPNSFYAKMGGPLLDRFGQGLTGLHRLLITTAGAILVGSVLAWLLAPRSREGSILVALTFVSGCVLAVEGVDDWLYWWHATLLALFSGLLLAHSMVLLATDGLTTSRSTRLLAGTMAVVFGLFLVAGAFRSSSHAERLLLPPFLVAVVAFSWRRSLVPGVVGMLALMVLRVACFDSSEGFHDFTATALALRRATKPSDTLATGAAGAIPYFTGLVTYDTLGINDVHIAHEPLETIEYGGFGHHRGDGSYILAKRPNVLLPCYALTASPDPDFGYEKTFQELSRMTEFGRLYEFHADRMSGGRYLNYYRLRESP